MTGSREGRHPSTSRTGPEGSTDLRPRLAVGLLLLGFATAPADSTAGMETAPCRLPGLDEPAECTGIEVPEDPARPDGRRIRLRVAILRATAERPLPDPIFVLAGGPGIAATGLASFARDTVFADLGGDRDFVLVDLRGLGESNPLHCELGPAIVDGALDELLPPDALAACRDRLSERADLRLYTTSLAVEDLERVRRALGYGRVNLYATSYGTRIALEWMRRHPDSLRAAILKSPVPPFLTMPSHHAADGQASLDAVFTLCARDPVCAARWPDPAGDLAKLDRSLADGPLHATVLNPESGRLVGVSISRGLLGEALRSQLYHPSTFAALPRALHEAASGDPSRLADAVLRMQSQLRAALSFGFLLSVTCAEDLPFVPADEARAESDATFFGAYRLDQQLAACAVWPRGEIPSDFHDPVRSAVPTLLTSGELDPVTPPRYGDAVAAELEDGTHLVVPFGSHSGSTGGCLERLQSEFIRAGTAANLDLTCLEALEPPRFAAPDD